MLYLWHHFPNPSMKNYLLWLLFCTSITFSTAQVSYPISSHYPTSPIFRYLLLTNAQIEVNDTINEEILDLSHPMVFDSILDRRKEHHQVFLVGWWIHAFGNYNWRAINMTKEKNSRYCAAQLSQWRRRIYRI